MEQTPLKAVATGDIVASTDLPSEVRRRLPDKLRETYADLRRDFGDELPHDLAISSGDSWQCFVEQPAMSLACILRFWALLHARGITSRMALAIDTVDFISEGGLNESDGPAFRRSGRGLQDLDDDRWFACLPPTDAPTTIRLAAESIAELVDHLLHDWTEAQARAVAGMLRTFGSDETVTQKSIAEQWQPEPITRQTVNRHLKRAHWDRLERTVTRFQQLFDPSSDHV